MVSCKKSEMKKSTILFRGESAPKESGKKLESLPLCGDPLDDLRSQLIAKANELGFSNEEINRRLKEEPHLAVIFQHLVPTILQLLRLSFLCASSIAVMALLTSFLYRGNRESKSNDLPFDPSFSFRVRSSLLKISLYSLIYLCWKLSFNRP